ncbi:hypothetical protein [Alienimonas chondri]|uniref:DUF202 domain-containing protein n=1 Tax=Alienimonas chondri TaxID=2681879 RepID=A0ABX1VD82_9PLAN|nr:hypothetical protein [Alienimonas chondri]NNJ26065.1 hypothetical protein [Alienimonas chondri]
MSAARPFDDASSIEELERVWARERHRLSLPGKAPGIRYEPTYVRVLFMTGTGFAAAAVLSWVLREEPNARPLPWFVAAVAFCGGLWLLWKTVRFHAAHAAYRRRRAELGGEAGVSHERTL